MKGHYKKEMDIKNKQTKKTTTVGIRCLYNITSFSFISFFFFPSKLYFKYMLCLLSS